MGLQSLAISYTNESYDRASHATLVRWLIARYPDLVPENLKGSLPTSPWASHDRATEVFLAVARQQHARGQMDPDLQMGLGVLFYTNGEFDKAKDCFESALAVRPKVGSENVLDFKKYKMFQPGLPSVEPSRIVFI